MRRRSEILEVISVIVLLPQRQVLLEELDDRLGVPEGFLVALVDFV